MANLAFNQQDIEDLAGKLSAVANELTEQERMLLVAIFAAAANQAQYSDKPADEGEAFLPVPEFWGQVRGTGEKLGHRPGTAELKRQLLDGYVPGKDLGNVTNPGAKIVGPRTLPGQ